MKKLTEADVICKKLQGEDILTIIKIHDLSLKFIKNNKDKFSEREWDEIIVHQKLSAACIRECQDEINWKHISSWQVLSEDFIREFQDKVNWFYISIYQQLSKKFKQEFESNIYNGC